MKRVLLIVGAAIALAYIVHALYFKAATHESQDMICDKDGQMEWLRTEFHLDDIQYSKIKALHEAFAPQCEQYCRNITEANGALSKLMQSSSEYTPEVAQALEKCARVQRECREATLKQIYAESLCMNGDQALRYRQMMGSRVIQQPAKDNHEQEYGR